MSTFDDLQFALGADGPQPIDAHAGVYEDVRYMSMSLRAALARFVDVRRVSGTGWALARTLDAAGVPALRRWPPVHVPQDVLTAQLSTVLRQWGMPQDHVAVTIEHLLYADVHGIASHGCAMLWDYHRGVTEGRLAMHASVSVVRETASTALVDGGGGLGHVPADLAMRLAIEKARSCGVASVAVRNSGHFGAAGSYARLAAREGLVAVVTTNTRTPAVVPTFGLDARLGTNPIAFAAPATGQHPYLLDMATSTAPVGRLMNAWRDGQTIPEGWALDARGGSLTDPREAASSRRLTPLGSTRQMGSHKGYGLATMVEVLSAVLPGVRHAQRGRPVAEHRVGHWLMVLDPACFREEGDFANDMEDLLTDLRSTPALDAESPVQVAGDPEHAAALETARSGVALSRVVIEDLRAICAASGVPFIVDTLPTSASHESTSP